jgi:hypothetical protein
MLNLENPYAPLQRNPTREPHDRVVIDALCWLCCIVIRMFLAWRSNLSSAFWANVRTDRRFARSRTSDRTLACGSCLRNPFPRCPDPLPLIALQESLRRPLAPTAEPYASRCWRRAFPEFERNYAPAVCRLPPPSRCGLGTIFGTAALSQSSCSRSLYLATSPDADWIALAALPGYFSISSRGAPELCGEARRTGAGNAVQGGRDHQAPGDPICQSP